MNLGGASNVDLSEAARLLKQSTGGAGMQNQQVPPPMMLMQQAVAMQQFQFQQALLMQQVMATQQAAARAATVKSAQEMAAARAAEISKLLKGNDPDVEEEKKSPGRSRSRTPSRSRSRSFSRSKSRSPIRYRRDRSASRSPIRYRRDSRPSPSRSRDYYGYRGRSRRGYYRGRGEHAWNPSYRRDWDRDRDHYSSRSRRSRSRSRSRVRRRSHSRSRSPRVRRDRSVTPPRHGREDRRPGHSSRRSKSVEAKPSLSHSSRSRSRSKSLHMENASLPRNLRDGGSGGGSRKQDHLSPKATKGQRALNSSPVPKDDKEKLHQNDVCDSEGEETAEQISLRTKRRNEPSISPARSLSVSLSPPRRSSEKYAEALGDVNARSDWKKCFMQDAVGRRTEELDILPEVSRSNLNPLARGSEGGVCSALANLEQEHDIKGAPKVKGRDFVEKGQNVKKGSGKADFLSDESDGDKEVDDWRDDIKANELQKMMRMETKRDYGRREEEKRVVPAQVAVMEDMRGHGVTLLEHLGKGSGKVPAERTLDIKSREDFNGVTKTRHATSGKELTLVETHVNLSKDVTPKEETQQRGYLGYGGRDGHLEEENGDVTKEKSTESADVAGEGGGEGDVVFEGPKLAYDEVIDPKNAGIYRKSNDSLKDLGRKIRNSSNDEDSPQEIGAEQPPSVFEEESGYHQGKEKLRLREEEDTHGNQRGTDESRPREEDDSRAHHKAKEKSRSRERSRRRDDETDRERRKDRHRKHKRKHRRDEETEKEEEDDEDDKRDVGVSKDKEERRHRSSKKHRSGRERNDDRRDKKKRRHKHRGKSPSESPEKDSSVAEVKGAEDVDDLVGPLYKKHASSCENRKKDVSKSTTHASGSASD